MYFPFRVKTLKLHAVYYVYDPGLIIYICLPKLFLYMVVGYLRQQIYIFKSFRIFSSLNTRT